MSNVQVFYKNRVSQAQELEELPAIQNLEEEQEGTRVSGVDKGEIYHDRQEMRLRGCSTKSKGN